MIQDYNYWNYYLKSDKSWKSSQKSWKQGLKTERLLKTYYTIKGL